MAEGRILLIPLMFQGNVANIPDDLISSDRGQLSLASVKSKAEITSIFLVGFNLVRALRDVRLWRTETWMNYTDCEENNKLDRRLFFLFVRNKDDELS